MLLQYILIAMLVILVAIVGLIIAAAYIKWIVAIEIKDSVISIELRVAGVKRLVLKRSLKPDTNKDKSKKTRTSNKNKDENSEDEGSWWKDIKERVYNPEKGGYQEGSIEEIIDEYREKYDEISAVLRDVLGGMRHKIEISRLKLVLDVGTGNPAHTGMVYAVVWGLVGTVYPILTNYFIIDFPQIEVTPDFYEKRLDFGFRSIIKVKPAHIINALFKVGIKQVFTYFQNIKNKGSVKNGRKQTSN